MHASISKQSCLTAMSALRSDQGLNRADRLADMTSPNHQTIDMQTSSGHTTAPPATTVKEKGNPVHLPGV